jgi:hypothetical protein
LYTGCIEGKIEWNSVSQNFKYFKIINLNITFLPRQVFVNESLAPLYMLVNYDGTRTPHIRVQDNVKIIPNNFFKYRTYTYKMANLNTFKRGWYTSQELENFNNVLIQLYAPGNNKKFYMRIDVSMVCRGPTSPAERTIVKKYTNTLDKSLNSSLTSEQQDRKDNDVSDDEENENKNKNKEIFGSSRATNLFEVIPEIKDSNMQQRVTQVGLDRLLKAMAIYLKNKNKENNINKGDRLTSNIDVNLENVQKKESKNNLF